MKSVGFKESILYVLRDYTYTSRPLCVCVFSLQNTFKLQQSNMITGCIATFDSRPTIVAAHNRTTVFAKWSQCARPSNTPFWRPPHSLFQTTTRSILPFLHGLYAAFFYTCVTSRRSISATKLSVGVCDFIWTLGQ